MARRCALVAVLAAAGASAASPGGADGGLSWCPMDTAMAERPVSLPEGTFREITCTRGGERVRTMVVDGAGRLSRYTEVDGDAGALREHWLYPNGQPWAVRATSLEGRGAREDVFWPNGCHLWTTTVATSLDDPTVNVHRFFADAAECARRLDAGAPLLILAPAVSQAHQVERPARVHHLRSGSVAFDGDAGVACLGGTAVCHAWSWQPAAWRLEWSSGARWAVVAPQPAADGGGDTHAVVFDAQRKSIRRLEGTFVAPSRLRLPGDGGVLDLGVGTRAAEPCEAGAELRVLPDGAWLCLGPQSRDVLPFNVVRGERVLTCAVRVATVLDGPYARAWAVEALITPGEPCALAVRQLAVYAPPPLRW